MDISVSEVIIEVEAVVVHRRHMLRICTSYVGPKDKI